jgi:G:T/U-mismatch repair DNA glycosylase
MAALKLHEVLEADPALHANKIFHLGMRTWHLIEVSKVWDQKQEKVSKGGEVCLTRGLVSKRAAPNCTGLLAGLRKRKRSGRKKIWAIKSDSCEITIPEVHSLLACPHASGTRPERPRYLHKVEFVALVRYIEMELKLEPTSPHVLPRYVASDHIHFSKILTDT